jgi:hypothetical protein
MTNWKTASQRGFVGDKVQITSVLGEDGKPLDLWIKPRLFSVSGSDEISSYSIQQQAKMRRETVKALLERGLEATEEALAKNDLIVDILGSGDPDLFKQRALVRMHLLYGIHAHNFGDEIEGPTDAWIDDVLEDPRLASELFKIVQGFNRPLARKTSDQSETSPNGNSKE